MSETFGLTGVDIDSSSKQSQQQQSQQQQSQQQPQQPSNVKKVVTQIVPKKPEIQKDEGTSNNQRSQTRLPPIETKKPTVQPQSNLLVGGGGNANNANPSTVQNKPMMRAKSSKSMINVRKIDNLKTFLDNQRQTSAKDEKLNRAKKTDGMSVTSGERMQLRRLELEKEKKEKKQMFLEGYRQKIEADFDALYKEDEYEHVVTQLKSLENKTKLQGEIQRNERMVREDQKEYNQIRYEIEKQLKVLEAIKNQTASLMFVFSSEEEKQRFITQENLQAEYDSKLETEVLRQMSLKNMMETRKKLLLFEKKQSEISYQQFVALMHQIEGYDEKIIKNKQKEFDLDKDINMYSAAAATTSKNAFEMHPRFQELLEDELSEYEDKNALNEIFKHEQERKDDLLRKEKEAKKHEQEQLQFERQKHIDKMKQEQRYVEQILNQKRKNMEELLKVSCVSDISELEKRKQFLEESNQQLKWFEEEYQESIDKFKQEIGELKKQLNDLKYIQKEKKGDHSSSQQQQSSTTIEPALVVVDEVNLTANVNIEKFEQVLVEETDKLQDKEGQVKRLERVVDEICLVFSRILYQLQPVNQKSKNIEVKREDLRNQITICGLKLEKIISFLAKKKDSLRVESINTDADNFQPPEYVGINPRSYLRQRDIEEQREFAEDQDVKFNYLEDDPNEFESDKYLHYLRKQVHSGADALGQNAGASGQTNEGEQG